MARATISEPSCAPEEDDIDADYVEIRDLSDKSSDGIFIPLNKVDDLIDMLKAAKDWKDMLKAGKTEKP